MRARCSAMVKTPKPKKVKPRHIRMSAETGAIELKGAGVTGAERYVVPNVAKSALKSDKLNDKEKARLKSARKEFEALHDSIAAGGEICQTQDALRVLSLEYEILAMTIRVPHVVAEIQRELHSSATETARKGSARKGKLRREIIKRRYRKPLPVSLATAERVQKECKADFENEGIEDYSVPTIKKDLRKIRDGES
jgi:hypothetical protein